MPDYLPSSDADFNTWQANFIAYVNLNLVFLGLTPADLVAAQAGNADWILKYPAFTVALAAYKSALNDKNDSRETYESALRAVVRQIQAFPNTTNAQRAAMGLPIPGSGPP